MESIVVVAVLAVALPALGFAVSQSQAAAARGQTRTSARLALIDHKLDTLLRHVAGGPAPDAPVPSVEELSVLLDLSRGSKIEAVAAHRARSGGSLAEAKSAVEHVIRSYRL